MVLVLNNLYFRPHEPLDASEDALSSGALERYVHCLQLLRESHPCAKILSYSELIYRSKVGMPNGYLSWG
jgi:hypothetical protein